MHRTKVAVAPLPSRVASLAAVLFTVPLAAAPDWVAISDRSAAILLRAEARFIPESSEQLGQEGMDEEIIDLKPDFRERRLAAIREAIQVVSANLGTEKDPRVREDLEIMLWAVRETARGLELQTKSQIQHINVTQVVFGGLRALLDDQVAPKRRQAALVRLKRYAGMEEGYTPIAVLAEQRTRERFEIPGLIGPVRQEVLQNLQSAAAFVAGIERLLIKYSISGYEAPLAELKQQLSGYNDFLRAELLPRAREDFRLPAEFYEYAVRAAGVDVPAMELAERARADLGRTQNEMEPLAARIAKARGWKAEGYREVIQELKKDQFVAGSILLHYVARLRAVEEIIRRERLVTLPARLPKMRLGTPAESASVPAPNMRPPKLIRNQGEMGEFVLPLHPPAGLGAAPRLGDFTFSAASWTLTAHELRPGHELQFASMVERGMSNARAVYAFNSANVEGWALYSEDLLLPFMPPEGQLIALQQRLLQAARAFLDPELHAGKTTPEEARRILQDEVALSEGMATRELERYMFVSPGQAISYYYGYTQLTALRRDVERAMGARFDRLAFHDFILAQGLLPPALLRKAVVEDFVGKSHGRRAGRAAK